MPEKQLLVPPDPSPEEWLTPDRVGRLQKALGNSLELLALSGQLQLLLTYWMRIELSREAIEDVRIWPESERDAEVDERLETWLAKRDPRELGLDDRQLHLKLSVEPGSLRWARWQWQHRLGSLFLQRKDSLDQASCRLLRLTDKHLAHELYHRVLAEEESFDMLSSQYGEGPERLHGGLIPLQSLESMPSGLAVLLLALSPGEINPPVRFSKGFALVQLLQFQPATLNLQIETTLLKQELNAWLNAMLPSLCKHLGLASLLPDL